MRASTRKDSCAAETLQCSFSAVFPRSARLGRSGNGREGTGASEHTQGFRCGWNFLPPIFPLERQPCFLHPRDSFSLPL